MLSILTFLFLCWLLADLMSGIGHFVMDRYFRSDWPYVGPVIAAPNELHHHDPYAFLSGDYLTRNWTTIFAALIGFAVTAPFTWWSIAFLFLTQANEIHAMSHRKQTGFIRMLQDTGILCSSRQHAEHHRMPYDCRYCAMSNFLNPALDYFRVWYGIERVLMWFSIHPKEQVSQCTAS